MVIGCETKVTSSLTVESLPQLCLRAASFSNVYCSDCQQSQVSRCDYLFYGVSILLGLSCSGLRQWAVSVWLRTFFFPFREGIHLMLKCKPLCHGELRKERESAFGDRSTVFAGTLLVLYECAHCAPVPFCPSPIASQCPSLSVPMCPCPIVPR